MVSVSSLAQDKLFMKSGDLIPCKVLEANTKLVKYNRWDNLSGPKYVIRRSDVEKIEYEKGNSQMSDRNTAISKPNTTVQMVQSKPDAKAPEPIQTNPVIDEHKAFKESKLKETKNYLLVIANQDYVEEGINDLDNPLIDAKRLTKILLEKYTFEKNYTTFLENPNRGDIIKAFDKLAQQVSSTDNLVIFYAGHGTWDEQLKKGYWLPKNAKLKDRSDWFSNSDLRDYIGGINSKHTLLIADACFSGSIFKTRDAFANSRGTDANVALELFKLTSRQAMTSGAMKSVPDKSVFIDYLCKRLDENQETFLGAEQLFGSFKIAVINNSPNGQIPQFGVIKESGDEGGDFLFIKR